MVPLGPHEPAAPCWGVRSFPPGGSGGPSGLRPQHLLDCLRSDVPGGGTQLLEGLLTFTSAAMAGGLEPAAVRILCGARLVPLRKPDGGVRPIAVGDTLRRVVAKWCGQQPGAKALARGLEPLQVAFVKGGPCEVLGMGARELVRVMGEEEWAEPWGLLQVDISNAFHTVRREAVLAKLREAAPSVLPWVRATMQPAALYCGDSVLRSAQGVQQGDPLGPLLFACALDAVLRKLPRGCRLNKWYLDDGALFGPVSVLHEALVTLRRELPTLGLALNMRKTTLWGPELGPESTTWQPPEHSPLGDVTRLNWEGGTTLLGVPVDAPRSNTQTEKHLDTIGRKFADLVEKVGGLADPQCAQALLRACLGPGKVLYALRTCDVFAGAGDFVSRVGLEHRRAFEGVVGSAISDAAWLQAGLPLRLGGCGIGGVEELAPVARLAAILQFELVFVGAESSAPTIACKPIRFGSLVARLLQIPT